ncbi:bacitracin ABC transporter ATP-binding protein [Paenibacillus baekrokdamisoli]|uniref:Bacitracin ABC transporter ATP-binding protein n=1 Tax=Paenibacillus baekrokdamisoli TaxID=1712516 RepID=A0A3G9IKD3_9BACL|nr:ABC transporter ATP-binding protein [Paenibacillus baekrokdamisoli]MBB3069272.1 ABC-2 type transport system ATP-binding protein [Paenibacillus baekrokdamisoli]BBH18756.1 bacitracin ABC transporter ATP-binding protein [Paenibacillus baekrokdamisoli]
MENIIEVTSLEKSFSNFRSLKDVSFKVRKGEIFGFLGPSGSGKTTTIKILTAQLKPTSGNAYVFGVPAHKLQEAAYRQKIGLVSDDTSLYGRLTVYDNLKLYCDLYQVPVKRIDVVLQMVNLANEGKRIVSKLSRGMLQRVTLARAFLHEPELLFLDEPTSALDPVNTKHIYEGLTRLKAKGTTIFLTTHDMNEAETLCDRVAFLNNGEIQLVGAPKKLCEQHGDGTLTVELTDGSEVIIPRGSDGAQQLYEYMSKDQVASVQSNYPTLGDIFVEVTGRELS